MIQTQIFLFNTVLTSWACINVDQALSFKEGVEKMSKPAFTPGPWKVYRTKFFGVPDDKQRLCVGTDKYSICKLTGSEGNDEALSDAQLIAAAPDMYEALEDAVESMEYALTYIVGLVGRDSDAEKYLNMSLRWSRSALAKARGGETR